MKPSIFLAILSIGLVSSIACASFSPTPSPTYTPAPTYTPFPTSPPVQTAVEIFETTVNPKPENAKVATISPKSSPLPNPTSTLASQPVATPPQIHSNWMSSGVEQDRLTDVRSTSYYTVSSSHNVEPPFSAPSLTILCSSSNEYLFEDDSWAEVLGKPLKVLDGRVKVLVNWGGKSLPVGDERLDTGIRFDTHQALTENWYVWSEYEETYTPFPEDFLYRAHRAESVYIEITDSSTRKFAAEFRLGGLADILSLHSDLCNIPSITVAEGDYASGRGVSIEAFATVYEPAFEIGIPSLDFVCLENGQRNFYFRTNMAGVPHDQSSDRSISDFVFGKLADSNVQFDSQAPYAVVWGTGKRLEPSWLPVFLENAIEADTVVIRGTLESGRDMRAEFDVSEFEGLMTSEPLCNN